MDQPAPFPASRPPAERGLPGWAWALIGGVVGAVLSGTIVWLFFAPAPIPGSSYGDDPLLDRAYDLCEAGDLGSCDLLWGYSEPGSAYEEFALTCGERRQPDAVQFCIEDERLMDETASRQSV